MKLIPCPACGAQLSPAARSCPHCGHAFPRKKLSPNTRIAIGLAVGIGLFIWWSEVAKQGDEELRQMQLRADREFDAIQSLMR